MRRFTPLQLIQISAIVLAVIGTVAVLALVRFSQDIRQQASGGATYAACNSTPHDGWACDTFRSRIQCKNGAFDPTSRQDCNPGTCAEGLCQEHVARDCGSAANGQTACLDSLTVVKCSDGQYVEPTRCPAGQYCSKGGCSPIKPRDCAGGIPAEGTSCDTSTSYVTCHDGAFSAPVRCGDGQTCSEGKCKSLTPPSPSPSPSSSPTATPKASVKPSPSSSPSSSPKASVCKPSTTECVSTSRVRTCNSAGTAWTESSCGTGKTCKDSKCVATVSEADAFASLVSSQCFFGAATCGSLGRYTSSSCAPNTCPAGRGVCCGGKIPETEKICTPLTSQCLGDSRVRVCNSAGTAWNEVACASGRACVGNRCVATETAGRESSQIASLPTEQCYFGAISCDAIGRYNAGGCAANSCPSGRGICCGDKKLPTTKICTPLKSECVDLNNVRVCDSSGTNWLPAACRPGTQCFSGVCREYSEGCPTADTCINGRFCGSDNVWTFISCSTGKTCNGVPEGQCDNGGRICLGGEFHINRTCPNPKAEACAATCSLPGKSCDSMGMTHAIGVCTLSGANCCRPKDPDPTAQQNVADGGCSLVSRLPNASVNGCKSGNSFADFTCTTGFRCGSSSDLVTNLSRSTSQTTCSGSSSKCLCGQINKADPALAFVGPGQACPSGQSVVVVLDKNEQLTARDPRIRIDTVDYQVARFEDKYNIPVNVLGTPSTDAMLQTLRDAEAALDLVPPSMRQHNFKVLTIYPTHSNLAELTGRSFNSKDQQTVTLSSPISGWTTGNGDVYLNDRDCLKEPDSQNCKTIGNNMDGGRTQTTLHEVFHNMRNYPVPGTNQTAESIMVDAFENQGIFFTSGGLIDTERSGLKLGFNNTLAGGDNHDQASFFQVGSAANFDEFFTEALTHAVTEPEWMKQNHPEIYAAAVKVLGTEYEQTTNEYGNIVIKKKE